MRKGNPAVQLPARSLDFPQPLQVHQVGVWIFMRPQNSHADILNPEAMVLVGGAFGVD